MTDLLPILTYGRLYSFRDLIVVVLLYFAICGLVAVLHRRSTRP